MRKSKVKIPKTIALLKSRRYKRMGKCNRCGYCCLQEDCEHLTFDNDNKATCLIHNDSNRPLKCKLYPQAPPILFESCGYHFLDLWENKRVVGVREV